MIGIVLAAALALGAGPEAAEPAPGDAAADAALPAGNGRAVLEEKCLSCHGADYLTQQRLTPSQWQRTIEKMRKFGADVSQADAEVLSDYLAQHWPVGKPEHVPAPVGTPAGALTATPGATEAR